MKRPFIVFIVGLIFAFAGGYQLMGVRLGRDLGPDELNSIEKLKQEFIRIYAPLFEIDFIPLMSDHHRKQLLDSQEEPLKLSVLSQVECQAQGLKAQGLEVIKKYQQWRTFFCHQGSAPLGEPFFMSPPYVHPSGHSYAHLYLKLVLKGLNSQKEWVYQHLSAFTLRELKELEEFFGKLPERYHYLAGLPFSSYRPLKVLDGPVLGDKYLYLPAPSSTSQLYWVYEKELFDLFLDGSPFHFSRYRKGKNCLLRDGLMCWNFTTTFLLSHLNFRHLAVLLFLVIVLLSVSFFLYHLLKKSSLENEQRRLALRLIGHELRTPIATMLLAVDSLMKDLDQFYEQDQETILSLSAAIHRLHRLVETSRNYLMVQQPGQLVKVTWKPIRNLFDYFEDLIEDYPNLVVNHPPEASQGLSFITDEYWLNVCLKNLINNAHYHGKLPVTLTYRVLGQQQRWLEIQIHDQGECEFTHLSEMTQEFKKGTSSQGSGLGLHITMQILTCINGELYFSSKPTTFTMRLKERYE